MIKQMFAVLLFTVTQIVSANPHALEGCEIPHGSYVVMSEASIIEKLGSPDHQETFKIKDGINEFRVELLNIYPPSNPLNLEATISERTWNRGDCRITVWFHRANEQDFSILSLGWHKDEEF